MAELLRENWNYFLPTPAFKQSIEENDKKAPKLYFFDTALVTEITGHSSPAILMNGAINGAILENYVVMEIIKPYTNNGLSCYAHCYRDQDSKEIDLILESDGELHPIEIKKTVSPLGKSAQSFKALSSESIPLVNGAVICTRKEISALEKRTAIVPVWAVAFWVSRRKQALYLFQKYCFWLKIFGKPNNLKQ